MPISYCGIFKSSNTSQVIRTTLFTVLSPVEKFKEERNLGTSCAMQTVDDVTRKRQPAGLTMCKWKLAFRLVSR